MLGFEEYYPVSFLKKAYILEIEQQYIPKMMVLKRISFQQIINCYFGWGGQKRL